MIADVCDMERVQQASAAAAHVSRQRAVVSATQPLVTTTLDDAAKATRQALEAFLATIPALLKQRDMAWRLSHERGFGRDYPAPYHSMAWRRRGAVLVDLGVGKTEVVIAEIVALISVCPDIRIAYVVPMHKLANGVVSRINIAAGTELVAVWRGLNQLDPDDIDATMCRRPEDADVVQRAGGELATLCGSKTRGYCPHHPESGGGCAYVRQQKLKPSIWVVPAAMLTSAPPLSMQRDAVTFELGGSEHSRRPPPFDSLILDEAPFLNFVGGFDDPVLVSPAWLNANLHRSTRATKQEEHDAVIEKALLALGDVVAAVFARGEALKDYYSREAGQDTNEESLEFSRAADLLFDAVGRLHVDTRMTGDDLAGHLRDRVERMRCASHAA